MADNSYTVSVFKFPVKSFVSIQDDFQKQKNTVNKCKY